MRSYAKLCSGKKYEHLYRYVKHLGVHSAEGDGGGMHAFDGGGVDPSMAADGDGAAAASHPAGGASAEGTQLDQARAAARPDVGGGGGVEQDAAQMDGGLLGTSEGGETGMPCLPDGAEMGAAAAPRGSMGIYEGITTTSVGLGGVHSRQGRHGLGYG